MISSFIPTCTKCGKAHHDFISRSKKHSPFRMALKYGWRMKAYGKWTCPYCRGVKMRRTKFTVGMKRTKHGMRRTRHPMRRTR